MVSSTFSLWSPHDTQVFHFSSFAHAVCPCFDCSPLLFYFFFIILLFYFSLQWGFLCCEQHLSTSPVFSCLSISWCLMQSLLLVISSQGFFLLFIYRILGWNGSRGCIQADCLLITPYLNSGTCFSAQSNLNFSIRGKSGVQEAGE